MPQQSSVPLALEWAVFVRDYGVDLKLSKEARVLGLALMTYGQGRNIFASMVTLSKVTGMKRDTVIKARRELQDKGLLEDITGDPDKQGRTYRLAMPDYVKEGFVGTLHDGNLSPERDTPVPQEGHNIKLVDQDKETHHHQADDEQASPEGQSQDRRGASPPRTPQPLGGEEPGQEDAPHDSYVHPYSGDTDYARGNPMPAAFE